MKHFSFAAFLALVLATIAAFFIAQHLKVSTPLIVVAPPPQPFPSAIDPVNGRTCYDPALHARVDYRSTALAFYLLHASDRVDVYIANADGGRVATLATNRFMQAGTHPVQLMFSWDGHEQNGGVAPPGTYYFAVHLIHQGRTVTISNNSGPLPVTVTARAGCP